MARWKRLKRIAIVVAAAILVLIVAAFFVLRSRAFHRFVLAEIVSHAREATGAKVQIGDFALHLASLHVDLYRVALEETEPGLGHLSLWVRHLGVNLKVISWLRADVGLREVDIDRPVVDFSAAPSNVQRPQQSKQASSSNTLFTVGINRVILDRGEIHFNDRSVPLEARLIDLQAQAKFDASKKEYAGALGYRTGEIRFGSYQPVTHSLDLRFSANADGMRADPLVIRALDSSVTVRATIKNYSQPVVNGSYSVALSAAEAAQVFQSSVKPAGEVMTHGVFAYRSAPDRPFLDTTMLSGVIGSSRLSVQMPQARGRVLALSGRYGLDHGNFTLSGVKADIFGGRLAANASIHDLAGHPRGSLTASLESISLGALRSALPKNQWANFPIEGRVNASARASLLGSLTAVRVSSGATMNATVMLQHPGQAAEPVAIYGALNAVYDAPANALTLRRTVLRTPQSEIDVSGKLGTHAALTVRAQLRDLHKTDQLVTYVRQFATPSATAVKPLGVSGSASFQGLIQGSLQHPKLTGEIAANQFRLQQAAFPHIQMHVSLSDSELAVSQGLIQAAQGSASFHASARLHNWAYVPSQPVSAGATANRMSVAALASLAHLQYPVRGILSAQLSVHGTASRPVGSGTVQVVKAEAWGQPIQDLALRFQGNGTEVQSNLLVDTQAGRLRANLTYDPGTERYQIQLNVPGLNLGMLRVLKAYKVSGVATASVQGQGTVKAPGLQANLSIPTLRLGKQTITGVSARMAVANNVATATLNSNFSGILAHANATVDLKGDYPATMDLGTGRIEAGPLLSTYLQGSGGNIQCETQLQASLRGPLKNPQRVQGHVEIPILRLGYQAVHLAAVSPIKADYQNGSLVVEPAEIKGTGTDFHFQASAPLESAGAIRALLTGTVNLGIMQIFEPQVASSGQFQINVAVQGTRSRPQMQGEAHIVNAAFSPVNAPLGVQNMNGTIVFNSTRAEIRRFTAQAGGGPVSASGSVSYEHGMQFDLAVKADSVRLSYPEGVHEVFSTQLRLLGTENAAQLSGQVLVNDLYLSPQFNLTTFTNQSDIQSTPAGPGNGFDTRTKLNIAVRSTHQLTLTNDQLSIGGTADLRVVGTMADPVVVGRVTLASGGSLLFNGERFVVQTGTIDFVNPVMIEPVLNVRLTTTVNQYDVTLAFTGPADRLRTTYSSNPPLAPADIISLLISGHPTEAPSTGLGAESVLAQGLGQASSRVLKMAGISSLTIDPQVGGNQTNPGVNIAMQKQVTKNLFFTFSVNTAMSEADTVQVQYQFTPRWSIQALRDPDGGYKLEIRTHKSF